MKTYIISYDLNKSGQNYNALYEAIKSYGTWAHHLDSTWFIKTDDSAQDIYKHLKPYIDSNDSMFIAKVDTTNYQGWMSQRFWDWWHG